MQNHLFKKLRGLFSEKAVEENDPVQHGSWSIGIFTGSSPFHMGPPENISNPVLTAEDVTDARANFIADPFMIKEDGIWNMFFEVEVQEGDSCIGKIGLATSSDGLDWNYRQIVLEASCHLSYPYVFKWDDEIFMVPETRAAREVQLYRAVDFPCKWKLEKSLLKGRRFADNSLFRHDDLWWMYTDSGNTTLRLYWARELYGPWREHRKSPLIKRDSENARPGGRVVSDGSDLIRHAQDCSDGYGRRVWGFRIKSLSMKEYREEKVLSPVITASGNGWNSNGMHTIDPHRKSDGSWIACVDGYGNI